MSSPDSYPRGALRHAALRRTAVITVHLTLWTMGYLGAFLLRFDGTIPLVHREQALYGLIALLGLRAAAFWRSGLFHGLLRYAGLVEVSSIIRSTAFATAAFVGVGVLLRPLAQPRSIYFIEAAMAVLLASALRLGVRLTRERRRRSERSTGGAPALLLGAGDAGELLMRHLEQSSSPQYRVIGILDDDPAKLASVVRGVQVLGSIDEANLRRHCAGHDVNTVILAIPAASGARVREIVAICQKLRIEVKTLPNLQQLLRDGSNVGMIRDVAIEDLLRRDPVRLDEASLEQLLAGKRVLITGGAGSIGSELARQVCRHNPAALGLLDHNENGLFFLERELRAAVSPLALSTFVGDIKDARRVASILSSFRPHVVLHAAAHKHVPLMEANAGEAIKNNVFGTAIVADLSNAYNVEAFILISTDKAVNPTSVMGSSKRIAEMYLQSLSRRARTRFAAVRFGNVLGSAGSVVQLFREQIARGGPVTITHPEMRRYFMTIPEATQLVLQAGALARGGEIFLLDMGEPVKIVDLARDMIRMSGLEPDVDVALRFSGPRPGEKLFEELFHDGEDRQRTVHSKIFVGEIAPVDPAFMADALARLRAVIDGDLDEILKTIAEIVPEANLESLRAETDEARAAMERLEHFDTLVLPAH